MCIMDLYLQTCQFSTENILNAYINTTTSKYTNGDQIFKTESNISFLLKEKKEPIEMSKTYMQ